MRVVHISSSDMQGGAAKACLRLVLAQRKSGLDASLLVKTKITNNKFVFKISHSNWLINKIKIFISRVLISMQKSDWRVYRSICLFDSNVNFQLNLLKPDLVHIHWIGAETISLNDLSKIKYPIVWTFHDMWAMCGAEHYVSDESLRFIHEYLHESRSPSDSGFDIDRWTFLRKVNAISNKTIHIIAPSQWMASCCHKSTLFGQSPVSIVRNIIGSEFHLSNEKMNIRELFAITDDAIIIGVGAFVFDDQIKGSSLIDLIISELAMVSLNTECVVVRFGGVKGESHISGIRIIDLGRINDDEILAQLYRAIDVLMVTSRIDNLPNIAVESIRCGTPVVAFNIGGLPDIIKHGKNGYLVEPFNVASFAFFLLKFSEIGKDSIVLDESFDDVAVLQKTIQVYQNAI